MNHQKIFGTLGKAVVVLFIASLFVLPGSATIVNEQDKNVQRMNNGGTTIYVDDDNTAGPWDGTLEHPYQFIQDGIDHAADDDTVFVFSGIYNENIVIFPSLTLLGENKERTIIDGDGVGTVVKITADSVSLSGFTITKCGSDPNDAGILIHTRYNTIYENNIRKNNYYGIHVLADDNTFYHNNIVENTYQAFDEVAGSAWDSGYPCGGNYWSDYTGTDENEDGIGEIQYPTGNSSADRYPLIHPYGSVVNINTAEIFLTIQQSIDDYDTEAGHMISVKNDWYPEHVHIYKSLTLQGENSMETIIDGRGSGTVVSICSCSVILQGFWIQQSGDNEQNAGLVVDAHHCLITGNIICDNYQGLVIKHGSEDNTISKNVIAHNNWNGLTLKPGCKGNIIVENTIGSNFYAGVGISEASYNYIYHNNFIENRYNAYDDATNIWDDGYPRGGNYWDDYQGCDGNSDGIGDTPYQILDGFNTDRYPYMAPYTGGDTIPPVVKITSPQNGLYLRDLHLFPRLFRHQTILFGDITIEVEASDVHSQIQKVEFYLDDPMHPIFVDEEAPYNWVWAKGSFLHHQHTITVIAYDNAGNYNMDSLEVRRYF